MKRTLLILSTVLLIVTIITYLRANNRRTYHVFYKAGEWGFCTSPTFIPYTTNLFDAATFSSITQNNYYTTKVFGTCPYTVIYRSEPDSTK